MNVGTVLVVWGGLTAVLCIASALDHWLYGRTLHRVQRARDIRVRGGKWV